MRNKIYFIHNSYNWYREPLFIELNNICDIKFLFTKIEKSGKIYNGIIDKNIKIADINYKIFDNFLGVSWELFKIVALDDYDTILLTALDNWPQIIEAFICAIIAKIRKKNITYFWERWDQISVSTDKERIKKYSLFSKEGLGSVYRLLRNYRKRFCFKLLSYFIDTFIAAGKHSKEYFILCGVDEEDIVCAPDTSVIDINKQKFNIEKKIDDNKVIIMYFGRIAEYKGLDILIRAFSKLEKINDNVMLLICGDGPYIDKCKKIVRELDVKNTEFRGIISTEYRAAYYSLCDIFVLPNKYQEPWGLSINEAMQFSKPVIATYATGAAVDLIINGENGFIIEPGNVNQLFHSLKSLVDDNDFRYNAGKRSKEIIKNNSYEKMALGFKKAFDRKLNNFG